MAQLPSITDTLTIHNNTYHYCSLDKAASLFGLTHTQKLPFTHKVLLENALRHIDTNAVEEEDIKAFDLWVEKASHPVEIAYHPSRVLMQDFTGVPAIVDLAAMRNAMKDMGGSPSKINPLCDIGLVIDHSIRAESYGTAQALEENTKLDATLNKERYEFIKWGQHAFDRFTVVPPGAGICHQVNLEHLGTTVTTKEQNGHTWAFPDTLVGTDSHTPMINSLGILGWGVGGIEAEGALLGQPISMLLPEVIGVHVTGTLQPGITATDLVLCVTEKLRAQGVVGKFVEYFGHALDQLPVADRATIANMSPENGSTCGYFPIDEETLAYMRLSGRSDTQVDLIKHYAQAQGLWRDDSTPTPVFTHTVELDLSTIQPSLAGPKRPQDRLELAALPHSMQKLMAQYNKQDELDQKFPCGDYTLQHGDLVIAAITSCTNTSNPHVMMAAGLLAKKAVERGLTTKPWVKTSLAPGSRLVVDYLKNAGLLPYLEQLGFFLVGFGCTTCIGNSGAFKSDIQKTIHDNELVVGSILSGNRNFEGRIHPQVKGNWLASPPLVVAYALAGTTQINMDTDPIGHDSEDNPIFLKDIWPSSEDIHAAQQSVTREMFLTSYAHVFEGTDSWKKLPFSDTDTYQWQKDSTYVKQPPFFTDMSAEASDIAPIQSARILALFGDSVTTDHISPAGAITEDSPAGRYLISKGIATARFNSFGSRRGNHEVMMRGTFANIRIRNEMLKDQEGGVTRYHPDNLELSIYDAAMRYADDKVPLIIIAGAEYGTGSSRDWAAKGPSLLGVKAVIAESFERIHRSNLIGMGVMPLRFQDGENRKTWGLTGDEQIDIHLSDDLQPQQLINVTIHRSNGEQSTQQVICRIDTETERQYFKHGGILAYILRQFLKQN